MTSESQVTVEPVYQPWEIYGFLRVEAAAHRALIGDIYELGDAVSAHRYPSLVGVSPASRVDMDFIASYSYALVDLVVEYVFEVIFLIMVVFHGICSSRET